MRIRPARALTLIPALRSPALVLALSLSLLGAVAAPGNTSAARPAGILLFAVAHSRSVAAGQVQKVWVHSMALADVTLKVDYGQDQPFTLHGTTDSAGVHQFEWTVNYTGTAVTLARYWVYVTRGTLATARRGDFVLFPAPPLTVQLAVLTPRLRVGETLRLRVHSAPGATLALSVRAADGHAVLAQAGQADASGDWLLSVPVSATIKQTQQVRVVVTASSTFGRHASAVGSFILKPRLVPRPLPLAGQPIPAAHTASLEAARRAARAAAAGSFAQAQANARSAVQQITVDEQVLGQWASAVPAHGIAYYQDLLAHATSYDDMIEVAAQSTADDALVEARMRAVMPHKAVMVSLGEQALRAYEDGRMVMFTYVTTGRPALPTVTGHFYIYEKVTPFHFISPWPPGSPYWYPPTWIKYWMPFYSGYGLHDAWWRAHYGPGTNVYGDGPGSGEPTGTHGCVNIPYANTVWLWNWAPVGTPVVVYGGPSVTPGASGI